MSRFVKASRMQAKARIALDGPSGSGKSRTALRLAFALAQGGKVAAIDTESGSLSKYAGDSDDGEGPYEFDVLELSSYSPSDYTSAIKECEREGYNVLVIDSLSHAWVGKGGALDLKDKQGGNSFTAWAKITPLHRGMVEAILQSKMHIIATMRSQTEYVVEEVVDDKGRKKAIPRKIGTKPVQREGMEYEFDLYGSMDWSHTLTVTKSRCPEMADATATKPGATFFGPLVRWLNTGGPAVQKPATAEQPSEPESASPVAKPKKSKAKKADADPSPAADSGLIVEIAKLKSDLMLTPEQWTRILDKRGVTTARQLNTEQQTDLRDKLKAKMEATSETLQEALAGSAETFHGVEANGSLVY